MDTVMPDIYNYITNLVDLQSLSKLLLVNKYFYNLTSVKPIMIQWKHIYASTKRHCSLYNLRDACRMGFLEYAKYLYNEHKYDHRMGICGISDAITISCLYGHLNVVQWLIQLHKSSNRTYTYELCNKAFGISCQYGHLDLAKWLILLGESDGYTKIDINSDNDQAFRLCCLHGHFDIAQWLIKLGESDGYTKINIHAVNDYAFAYSCMFKYFDIAQWLIKLGESGYGEIEPQLIKKNEKYIQFIQSDSIVG